MSNLSFRWIVALSITLTAWTASPALGQTPISRAGWTLHFVDSEDLVGGNYAAINVFDGDSSTMWATEWYLASPPPPHDLQINLGAVYNVSGFRYLPRQDGDSGGKIASYQFYVSADGVTWGAAVASGTFANTDAEQQVVFTSKSGRYIRLRALTEVYGQPWSTVAELNVLASATNPPPSNPPPTNPPPSNPPPSGSGTPISRAGWTLRSVDSQDMVGGDYAAINVFDGDPNTMWATEWYLASPPPPHDLQINLGAVYDVSGFRYLPRQDGDSGGKIASYQFYVSTDGVTWGTAVASGTFPNTAAEQQVVFASKSGRYIRLRALSEVNGQPWTTVAELNVLAGATTGNPPPTNPPPTNPPPTNPPPGGNQFPVVSLADTGSGGPYLAPASVSLRATASDADGTVTRVDFYAGSTIVAADTTTPYTVVLPSLGAATYAFRAAALDNSGNTTVSNTITIVVGQTRRVVFEPSTDHDTLVQRYLLEIFPVGANVSVANPVATMDLGKPSVVNGECQVDVSALTSALSSGVYIGTVTSVGDGGTSQSNPSASFVR